MSDVLHRMIHRRCDDAWKRPFTKEDYPEYYKVWIKSAEELRDEFKKDGLTCTAEAVQRFIDFNAKYASPGRNNARRA